MLSNSKVNIFLVVLIAFSIGIIIEFNFKVLEKSRDYLYSGENFREKVNSNNPPSIHKIQEYIQDNYERDNPQKYIDILYSVTENMRGYSENEICSIYKFLSRPIKDRISQRKSDEISNKTKKIEADIILYSQKAYKDCKNKKRIARILKEPLGLAYEFNMINSIPEKIIDHYLNNVREEVRRLKEIADGSKDCPQCEVMLDLQNKIENFKNN